MNKKLVAVAVASALAAPTAMAASHGVEFTTYARINNGVQIKDVDGGDSVISMRNIVSRLGFKGKADLGNGLTALGHYEFFTFTLREGSFDNVAVPAGFAPTVPTLIVGGKGRGGINDTRIGSVGLSGPFGTVTLGNQWSAFYNAVGSNLDPTYTLGYYLYSSISGGPYRTSNTIKYANDIGPVHAELDIRISGDGPTADSEVLGRNSSGDDLDGFGIGAVFNATENISVHAAFDSDARLAPADDVNRLGLSVKGSFGKFWASASYMNVDPGVTAGERDMIQLYGGTKLGDKTSLLVGFGTSDLGGAADATQLTLGVYHNMGSGFRLWGEFVSVDGDGAFADFTHAVLGMRFDFST